MEGEISLEEYKKCISVHGYVSSCESTDDDSSDSQLELDSEYEAFKPRPIEIDPTRHKIIEVSDVSDNESTGTAMSAVTYAELLKKFHTNKESENGTRKLTRRQRRKISKLVKAAEDKVKPAEEVVLGKTSKKKKNKAKSSENLSTVSKPLVEDIAKMRHTALKMSKHQRTKLKRARKKENTDLNINTNQEGASSTSCDNSMSNLKSNKETGKQKIRRLPDVDLQENDSKKSKHDRKKSKVASNQCAADANTNNKMKKDRSLISSADHISKDKIDKEKDKSTIDARKNSMTYASAVANSPPPNDNDSKKNQDSEQVKKKLPNIKQSKDERNELKHKSLTNTEPAFLQDCSIICDSVRISGPLSYIVEEEPKVKNLLVDVGRLVVQYLPQDPENFINELKRLEIVGQYQLQAAVNAMFDQLVAGADMPCIYASVCKKLASIEVLAIDKITNEPKKVNFVHLMVKKCRHEIEWSDFDDRMKKARLQRIQQCKDPILRKQMQFKADQIEHDLAVRGIKNAQFIGELYKQNMFPTPLIFYCCQNLLANCEDLSLERLYHLLMSIGKDLEAYKDDINGVYSGIKTVIRRKRSKCSPRIRCLLQDLMDQRKQNHQFPDSKDDGLQPLNQGQNQNKSSVSPLKGPTENASTIVQAENESNEGKMETNSKEEPSGQHFPSPFLQRYILDIYTVFEAAVETSPDPCQVADILTSFCCKIEKLSSSFGISFVEEQNVVMQVIIFLSFLEECITKKTTPYKIIEKSAHEVLEILNNFHTHQKYSCKLNVVKTRADRELFNLLHNTNMFLTVTMKKIVRKFLLSMEKEQLAQPAAHVCNKLPDVLSSSVIVQEQHPCQTQLQNVFVTDDLTSKKIVPKSIHLGEKKQPARPPAVIYKKLPDKSALNLDATFVDNSIVLSSSNIVQEQRPCQTHLRSVLVMDDLTREQRFSCYDLYTEAFNCFRPFWSLYLNAIDRYTISARGCVIEQIEDCQDQESSLKTSALDEINDALSKFCRDIFSDVKITINSIILIVFLRNVFISVFYYLVTTFVDHIDEIILIALFIYLCVLFVVKF